MCEGEIRLWPIKRSYINTIKIVNLSTTADLGWSVFLL